MTVDDFVKAMEDANGADLSQFKRWYSQAGTPRLSVSEQYDEAAQTYRLTFRQSCPPTPGQPAKEPFVIPVELGLLAADGSDLPLRLQGEAQAGVPAAYWRSPRPSRASPSSTCPSVRSRLCCAASPHR